MEERRQPFFLVPLENRGPGHRSDDEDKGDDSSYTAANGREMRPADASEVHDGEGGDHEHHRGAEVGLQEDESGRKKAEAEVADGPLDRRAAPGAIDHEPGKRKHEQELAELRWLETEEGKFEGASRAASGEAEDEDQGDAGAEEGVDADPQLAEAGVVDPGQQQHPGDAEDGVDRLAVEVVMGTAGDVVLRRLPQGEDAEYDEGDGRDRQRPVHVGEAEALADADVNREGLWSGLPGSRRVHHSVSVSPFSSTPSIPSPASPASRLSVAIWSWK